MVTSTYNKFNSAVLGFANGLFRCSSIGDTFTFLLTNTAPTSTWMTSTDNTAISSGNGYGSSGGTVAIASSTLGATTVVPTPVIVLGATVTFTASSAASTAGIGPFRYTIFADLSTNLIINSTVSTGYWTFGMSTVNHSATAAWFISWYDYGSALTLTPGETFTISPDASSGIFQIA